MLETFIRFIINYIHLKMTRNIKKEEEMENFLFNCDDKYVEFYKKESFIKDIRFFELPVINKYFVKNEGKVLKICCKTGRTEIGLYKRGFTVVGIDFCNKMIEIANERKREINAEKDKLRFFSCDVRNFGNLIKEYFDYIICDIRNVPKTNDRIKIYKEACKKLNEGGILFVTCYIKFNILIILVLKIIFLFVDIYYLILGKLPQKPCLPYHNSFNSKERISKKESRIKIFSLNIANFKYIFFWLIQSFKLSIVNFIRKYLKKYLDKEYRWLEIGDFISNDSHLRHYYYSLKEIIKEFNGLNIKLLEYGSYWEFFCKKKYFFARFIDGLYCFVFKK